MQIPGHKHITKQSRFVPRMQKTAFYILFFNIVQVLEGVHVLLKHAINFHSAAGPLELWRNPV